jgi:hypothetical protein
MSHFRPLTGLPTQLEEQEDGPWEDRPREGWSKERDRQDDKSKDKLVR